MILLSHYFDYKISLKYHSLLNCLDLIDKKIESQIEFASVCIKIENIPRAITLLSDAYEDLEVFIILPYKIF